MKNSVQITLIISTAIIILALIGIYFMNQQLPSSKTISVTGESTQKVMPDLVGVYFTVETSAKTSQEAKDKNSEIVDKVIADLIKQGIAKENIATENFNIYPDYSWANNKQTLLGYKATHSMKVELSSNQSEKIGNIIDAGVNAGALISYINFELSTEKQNQYKAEALKAAAQDAKIKAESVASGLGKKLGDIVSTSDSSFDYYPWRLYDNMATSSSGGGVAEAKLAATSIQPGNQDISARISVTYKIK
jgi:uncharacterized protein